jgi:hypothetical protein
MGGMQFLKNAVRVSTSLAGKYGQNDSEETSKTNKSNLEPMI